MPDLHIWLNEKREDHFTQRNMKIESTGALSFLVSDYIVFRIDSGITGSLPLADPYLPILAMIGMAEGQTVKIHAPVSREAIYNVYEFQNAWRSWMPALFRAPVDIVADDVVDVYPTTRERAVQAFSGGLDAHFTTLMHKFGGDPLQRRPLDRAVFAHGFDIDRNKTEAFNIAADRARRVLDTVEVSLSTVRTNIRAAVNLNWELVHGPAIAAALGQFIPEYSVGLIGSSSAYNALRTPWGSNPITDPLMSGGAMRFVHDGAGYTRNDKVRKIASWPLAAENLRVCWKSEDPSVNCGVCGKCIRTALAFEVWGLAVPENLKAHITPDDIAGCEICNYAQLEAFKELHALAIRNGIRTPWRSALRRRIAEATAELDNVVDTEARPTNSIHSMALNHH